MTNSNKVDAAAVIGAHEASALAEQQMTDALAHLASTDAFISRSLPRKGFRSPGAHSRLLESTTETMPFVL